MNWMKWLKRNRSETIEAWARRTGAADRIRNLYNPAPQGPDKVEDDSQASPLEKHDDSSDSSE